MDATSIRPEKGRLQISVLGTPSMRVGSREVAFPPGRPGRLLAALVVADGHAVPDTRLVDLVWDDEPPANERAALHTTVNRARQALGAASDLLVRRFGGYALLRDATTVDADEFTAAAATARRSGRVSDFDEALALWGGPPWAGFDGDVFEAEARALQEEKLTVLEGRAEAQIRSGRAGDALGVLRTLVTDEPFRERAVGLLMEALHMEGNVAEALSVHDAYRVRLADELGLDPSAELSATHQKILQRVVDTPTTLAPETRRLPVHAIALYGRQQHLAEIREMLQRYRCVTVTGPGGVGKTSVITDIALEQHATRDVWWVDLTQVSDPSSVCSTIAEDMGAQTDWGGSVEEALLRRLRVAQGLLVLDNCEHLLGAVADVVADVLAVGDGMWVVATSRERLGVTGEHVYPLPPLELPPSEEGTDAEATPAVALFMDRATAATPELRLDQDTIADVVALVRALDGLPLAIELAAGRTGSVTLGDLRRSLTSALELFTTTAPRIHERHRALTATIAWSFDLLSDEQQQVFVGLSVFAAPFSLDAVEAVLGRGAAATVPELVEQSLVVRPTPTGPGRYRLLETLRAFAASRLQGDVAAAVRQAHAKWAGDVARRAGLGILGPDEVRHATDIEEALPDLRAGFEWAKETRDEQLVEGILGDLHRWAYFRVRPDVLGWAVEALGPDVAVDTPAVRSVAACHCWMIGQFEQGRRHAERAIEEATVPPSRAYDILGDILMAVGELDAAMHAYQSSVEGALAHGNTVDAVLSAGGVVLSNVYAGHPDPEAMNLLQELTVSHDNPTTAALLLYCEGEALALTKPAEALHRLAAAVEVAEGVGNRLVRGVAMSAATALRSRHGTLDRETVDHTRKAIEHWLGSGNENLFVTCLRNVVPLLARFGKHGAVVELAAALAANSSERQPYGNEAEGIDAALSGARQHLGSAFDEAWDTGRRRTTLAAARAVLETLSGLAVNDKGRASAAFGNR